MTLLPGLLSARFCFRSTPEQRKGQHLADPHTKQSQKETKMEERERERERRIKKKELHSMRLSFSTLLFAACLGPRQTES